MTGLITTRILNEKKKFSICKSGFSRTFLVLWCRKYFSKSRNQIPVYHQFTKFNPLKINLKFFKACKIVKNLVKSKEIDIQLLILDIHKLYHRLHLLLQMNLLRYYHSLVSACKHKNICKLQYYNKK